jgi:hypothetical protein
MPLARPLQPQGLTEEMNLDIPTPLLFYQRMNVRPRRMMDT